MGRKKIKIRTIENDRQKTVTFTRRRSGLIKKAHELAVLCDCRVVLLMFDAKDACHMYSSEEDPEELIHKYYRKEFQTVEGKKRKVSKPPSDHLGPTKESRKPATTVVNEYRITTNGEGSENIQVKQVKHLHNPGSMLLPLEQPIVGSSNPMFQLPPAFPSLEDYSIIPMDDSLGSYESGYNHPKPMMNPGYLTSSLTQSSLNNFQENNGLLDYHVGMRFPNYQIPTDNTMEWGNYASHPSL
ncbi:hypothetical protein K7432_006083 [Basidiobolus ranarum]|uniref:MADS-box domain-containing protein n=1 Tax=Basidiobolus ranarum TaxID=34480 RepID=A0ABR2WVN4_9FUNG